MYCFHNTLNILGIDDIAFFFIVKGFLNYRRVDEITKLYPKNAAQRSHLMQSQISLTLVVTQHSLLPAAL